MEKYILAFDQGTTSSRAFLFDKKGNIVSQAQREFKQYFPRPAWVEHDPMEIWSSQISVAAEALSKAGLSGQNIASIGITNQRETVVVWNKKTGKPIYNAVVWQDKRTAKYCDELKAEGLENQIREKTGLVLDAYFSATKVKWILDHVAGARESAKKGELLLGTIDTWLIWNLSQGELHITDVSNASRTQLFNINTLAWDEELIKLFNIPRNMLPDVRSSSEIYGYSSAKLFAKPIPIAGIAGDQQAALFGQLCLKPGMVKNTYGTGCFMLMNIGNKPLVSKHHLLTTIAWQIGSQVVYALEGSLFVGGAVVQWLRDSLQIIQTSDEVEKLALSVKDSAGVFFVPAFAGLGTPHWNQHALGTIFGLNRGSTKAHIARAALEAIAYQSMDVLKAMEADSGIDIQELRVDGGATVNTLLMQFQADILNTQSIRPKIIETTVMGAAFLAGLGIGFWKSTDEIQSLWQSDIVFKPDKYREKYEQGIKNWYKAVDALQYWTKI